jgi:addiction module RelE/StbE family toxin
MTTKFSKDFDKQFAKLPKVLREKVIETVDLFLDRPMEPSLRNHPLTKEWHGYRSISADSDLRLHFKILDGDIVYFVAVGTHSQLYK